MDTYMFVLRYGDDSASLDACIVFVECAKPDKDIRKSVIQVAEDSGIVDPKIVSETCMEYDFNLSESGLYPDHGYAG